MTRILVVDDSKVDRLHVQSLLEAEDYEVVTAPGAEEALEFLQFGPPHAVLTDLVMPGMSGLELVAALRERRPDLPVVLMTSRGSEETAVEALRAGAASYVPKASLSTHLAETLDDVLALSEERHEERELFETCLQSEVRFALSNDVRLARPLARHVQESARRMGLCDATQANQLAMAINEAVQNAAEHGNLELSSDMREDDIGAYVELMKERATQPPWKDRRIDVDVRLDRNEGRFTIRDEGAGFDPTILPDPHDPANLEKISGRGVLLMRTFMDEVHFNEAGNEVTLVKRRG